MQIIFLLCIAVPLFGGEYEDRFKKIYEEAKSFKYSSKDFGKEDKQ